MRNNREGYGCKSHYTDLEDCDVRDTALGFESQGKDIFHTLPDWPQGPASTLYNGYRVPFPGESGQGIALSTHLPTSAEFKEEAELYLCSPTGPSWPVLGRPLPLSFYGTKWQKAVLLAIRGNSDQFGNFGSAFVLVQLY